MAEKKRGGYWRVCGCLQSGAAPNFSTHCYCCRHLFFFYYYCFDRVSQIECALRDYVKGFKETRRGFNEFSGDSYRGSYESHLLTLRRQEKKHPQLILKLRRDIFQAA